MTDVLTKTQNIADKTLDFLRAESEGNPRLALASAALVVVALRKATKTPRDNLNQLVETFEKAL